MKNALLIGVGPHAKRAKFLNPQKMFELGLCEKGESVRDIFARVVKTISNIEKDFSGKLVAKGFGKQMMGTLMKRKLIPSTTVLMNAGRFDEAPLSACAVPPVNLCGDMDEVKTIVDSYHFNGMGTGFNFDSLKDPIGTIEYLNQVGVTGQNNKAQLRPVGNMGVISIDHPKILEYIKIKMDSNRNKKWVFNFSINITDDILSKMVAGDYITLRNGKRISTEKLLDQICEAIYFTGDPGLAFIDRFDADNQVPAAGKYESFAPCGEVGLAAGETCQFAYINLGEFVKNKEVDYKELRKTIFIGARFLDDAVEYNTTKRFNMVSCGIAKDKRKIGLGACGFADMLDKLGIDYSSQEARAVAEELFSFINFNSKKASVELAKERGSFGKYSESKYTGDDNIIRKYSRYPTRTVSTKQWRELEGDVKANGIRNCATVALPPTGRSSLIIGASASIEPRFEMALKISPRDQLLMAATIQLFVDESISKTVNMPEESTAEDIKSVLKMAMELPLKGITIYRDKSRSFQPINLRGVKMESKQKYNFQYCQKLVVFSPDMKKVLLCKRKGENDYDGVYSFIGGKMETTDKDLVSAMQREKNEEVGENFKVKLYKKFSNNLTFKKKSGDYMILPHYLGIYVDGEVKLSDEYSDYKWVEIDKLEEFEPKIENVAKSVNAMLALAEITKDADMETI